MTFEEAMIKHGLSILPRFPNPHILGYKESSKHYKTRHKYAVRSHSLVIDYIENRGVEFRSKGLGYYQILRMALDERGIDWKDYWQEWDTFIEQEKEN